MHIRGYAFDSIGAPLSYKTWDAEPAPGQVLIQIDACGVCHTDLGYYYDGVPTRRSLPLVLGHEIVGTVVEAPGSGHALLGRRVIAPAVMPCLQCDLCERGRGDICHKQVFPGCDVDGGFASHVILPSKGLCPIPNKQLSRDETARLAVVADAVSTAYQAILKSQLSRGELAIVVGAGGVGSFVSQIAKVFDARVLALDVDDARLALAREHGADWTLNVAELTSGEIKKRARAIVREAKMPNIEWRIFECSGTGAGQATAFSLLTYGASLIIIGYYNGDATVRISNLMAFAARAEGTWGCLPEHFPAVLNLVLTKRVALAPFVEIYPMSKIQSVFERLRKHEIRRRPILVPDFGE